MRLYNGCPDSELKALWDERDKAKAKLAKLGIRCTYFPVEAKYMGFSNAEDKPVKIMTDFFDSPQAMLQNVLAKRDRP